MSIQCVNIRKDIVNKTRVSFMKQCATVHDGYKTELGLVMNTNWYIIAAKECKGGTTAPAPDFTVWNLSPFSPIIIPDSSVYNLYESRIPSHFSQARAAIASIAQSPSSSHLTPSVANTIRPKMNTVGMRHAVGIVWLAGAPDLD